MLRVDSYVPLSENEHGVLRITGTRVSLDSVIAAFEQGETPKQITQNFSALKLEDVYAVITYYLRNREMVITYLAEQKRVADDLRRKIQEDLPTHHLRERVLRRQREKAAKGDA